MNNQEEIQYKRVMKIVAMAVANQTPLVKEATKIARQINAMDVTDNGKEPTEEEMIELDEKAKKYVGLLALADGYSTSINLLATKMGVNYFYN
ncbi:MAG: hypothetical protein Q8O88_03970 [bacterium]|nr:hypothetical protein [bacterium]